MEKTNSQLDTAYDPKQIEQKLYDHWENQGYFKPNGNTSQESFCIMIPPPNVTGSLHMGHAFQQTIMDTMIRYQRMQGKKHPVAGGHRPRRHRHPDGGGAQDRRGRRQNPPRLRP